MVVAVAVAAVGTVKACPAGSQHRQGGLRNKVQDLQEEGILSTAVMGLGPPAVAVAGAD